MTIRALAACTLLLISSCSDNQQTDLAAQGVNGSDQEPEQTAPDEMVIGRPDTMSADTISKQRDEISEPVLSLTEEVEGAYGIAWNVSEGWPGEYPNGFSVEAEGVVIPARSIPVISSSQDISCPLDKGVTIQQWNHARVETDKLNFIVANQILPLDIDKAGTLTAWAHDDPETDQNLTFSPGDSLLVTRYFGEGFGEIQVNGVKYTTDLESVFELAAPNEMNTEEHLWVQLACDNLTSSRAWVLYHEAIELSGVIDTPITEYGASTDLE